MDLSSINSEPKRVALFDDNEDFEFKPLSEGLGFHHEEKMTVQPSVAISKTNITKKARPVHSQQMNTSPSSFIQSDLALFYENKKGQDSDIFPEPVMDKSALKTTRFAAYMLDFVLVALVTAFTMILVSKMTGVDFVDQLSSLEEMALVSVGFIFLSYYFVYFTLLEKMQAKTLGMDLFGIKLQSTNDLSLTGIFFFEAVILLGFLSLGLTNYFSLPEMIFGIKVIEKK